MKIRTTSYVNFRFKDYEIRPEGRLQNFEIHWFHPSYMIQFLLFENTKFLQIYIITEK